MLCPRFDRESISYLFGSPQYAMVLGLVTGLFYGGVFGALIGLFVALANAKPFLSMLIGTGTGILVAAVLFVLIDDSMSRVLGTLAVPTGALVGFVTGLYLNRRHERAGLHD